MGILLARIRSRSMKNMRSETLDILIDYLPISSSASVLPFFITYTETLNGQIWEDYSVQYTLKVKPYIMTINVLLVPTISNCSVL